MFLNRRHFDRIIYRSSIDARRSAAPFSKWIYGIRQITEACLLSLAVHDVLILVLILVTMDTAILRVAGDRYREHVVLLTEPRTSSN